MATVNVGIKIAGGSSLYVTSDPTTLFTLSAGQYAIVSISGGGGSLYHTSVTVPNTLNNWPTTTTVCHTAYIGRTGVPIICSGTVSTAFSWVIFQNS